MKYTNNLGLCMVEAADRFSPEPLSENAEKLDAAVASLTRPNLLDNWYFADPVNGRGQSEYAGAAQFSYTIDRWETSNPNTIVTVGGGVTVSASAESATPYLLQPVQDGVQLLGKTVTLSLMTGDGAVKWASATLPAAMPAATTSCAAIADHGHLIFMGGKLYVRLRAAAGGSNTFLAVKLEQGAFQTLAHLDGEGKWVLNDPRPHKTLEAVRCCVSTADPLDEWANDRKTAALLGGVQTETGVYTGTGGRDGALSFGFTPRFVYIAAPDGGTVWIAGQTSVGVGDALVTVEQNGNSLSWHGERDGLLNGSGETYHYFAMG